MLRRLAWAPFLLAASVGLAQDRLPLMPGWDQNQNGRPKMMQGIQLARLAVNWIDSENFAYQEGGEWVIHHAPSGKETRQKERPAFPPTPAGPRRPPRGRQLAEAASPDGKWRAIHRDRNIILASEGKETKITTEGSTETRVKFGQASWVYGEELDQTEAMGWSPDSRLLWFYRFDEGKVLDYYLTVGHRSFQVGLEVEAYPKPGTDNPVVDLMVYNPATEKTISVKARPGAFDEGVGHYVYGIRWSPDSRRLLFYRTDRRQKVLEFCSADPATGEVVVLDREENPSAWVENSCPTTYFDEQPEIEKAPDLKGKALWMSERSGWLNLYLLDLEKGGVTPVTSNEFDVRRVVSVDLETRKVWYLANSSSSGRTQLHWASLDGKKGGRITDGSMDHTVSMGPGAKWFVDTAQSVEQPPVVRVLDHAGKVARVLKESKIEGLAQGGYRPTTGFVFTSADGKTPLAGAVHYPANFDPSRRYPALFEVYNGPLGPMSDSWNDSYRLPGLMTDFGFLVVQVETRGGGGRGRAFKNALYQKMGITEIDDIAAAARHLASNHWFDAGRVGIEGTSYGGYATLMAMLRYPDLFQAGASQSCVSDWRQYDTIYTERYMGVLPESKEFYDASSAVELADRLRGFLMVYYGTSDDNTHPANSLMLIRALQQAGKSFEVQVGVDVGHSGMNWQRRAEFFIERLGAGR